MPKKRRRSDDDDDDDDEARNTILTYFRDQNRPFNEKMLFQNLRGAVSKKDVARVIGELLDEQVLVEKVNGKQRVYWYNQAQLDVLDDEQLAELDTAIAELEAAANDAKERVAKYRRKCAALGDIASNDQVDSQLANLERMVAANSARLDELRTTKKRVTRAEFETTKKKLVEAIEAWGHRRRLLAEMIDVIADRTDQKVAELRDDIGIEPVPHDDQFDTVRTTWT